MSAGNGRGELFAPDLAVLVLPAGDVGLGGGGAVGFRLVVGECGGDATIMVQVHPSYPDGVDCSHPMQCML